MKRSWISKHWPVVVYILVSIILFGIVWILGYRVGLEKGELIQYNTDIAYVEELQEALQEEIDEIHTCPYCNKIFTDWR